MCAPQLFRRQLAGVESFPSSSETFVSESDTIGGLSRVQVKLESSHGIAFPRSLDAPCLCVGEGANPLQLARLPRGDLQGNCRRRGGGQPGRIAHPVLLLIGQLSSMAPLAGAGFGSDQERTTTVRLGAGNTHPLGLTTKPTHNGSFHMPLARLQENGGFPGTSRKDRK